MRETNKSTNHQSPVTNNGGGKATSRAERSVTMSQTQVDMIQAAGGVCQALGLPKSVGQVFGYLYMSTIPQTLDDIAASLQISKASASNSVRQISGWGAARTVWVPGARKEHYEVVGDLNNLVSGFVNDFLKPKFSIADKKLAEISTTLEEEKDSGIIDEEQFAHYSKKIKQINKLQRNVRKLAPLARRLL